jgi:hypothetical protein
MQHLYYKNNTIGFEEYLYLRIIILRMRKKITVYIKITD